MPRRPLLLVLLAAVATAGALACNDDPVATDPSSSADSSVVRLTVSLSPGVLGSPSSNTPFPRGYTVTYSYNALPGYTDLRVTLDGTPIAAAGSFKIDAARTLSATATRVAAAARPTTR